MSAPDNDTMTEEEVRTLFAPMLVDPRTLPVRFSRLKLMGQSPAHYFAACQRQQSDETLEAPEAVEPEAAPEEE